IERAHYLRPMQDVARSEEDPEEDKHVRQQRDVDPLADTGPRPLVFQVVDEVQQLIGFHTLIASGGFPAKFGTGWRLGRRALRWWNFCNRHALCVEAGRGLSPGRSRQEPALPSGYC